MRHRNNQRAGEAKASFNIRPIMNVLEKTHPRGAARPAARSNASHPPLVVFSALSSARRRPCACMPRVVVPFAVFENASREDAFLVA